jgi:hypothetical protein
MPTKILAAAALVLTMALAGCATAGRTSTYASLSPFYPDNSVPAADGTGNAYRVYPGDENLEPSDIAN